MSIISAALKKTQTARTPEIKQSDNLKPLFPENISLQKPLGLKKLKSKWKRSAYIRKSLIAASLIIAAIISWAIFRSIVLTPEITPAPNTPIQKKQFNPITRVDNIPNLTGIMFSPTKPYAIINKTLVHEGTTVTGFTVIKISPNSVILSKNNTEFTLLLK